MATHDHDRLTPRDYMQNARTRYTQTDSGTKWVGFTIGFALIAFIMYMLFSAANPTTTGEAIRQTPPTPQTTTAPRTTTVPSEAPTTQPAPAAPTTQPK